MPNVAGDSAEGDVATTVVEAIVVDVSVIRDCCCFIFSTFHAFVSETSDSPSVYGVLFSGSEVTKIGVIFSYLLPITWHDHVLLDFSSY